MKKILLSFLGLLIFAGNISASELKQMQCTQKNNTEFYSVVICYSKEEANRYFLATDGVIIKEQGKEIYYVFSKNALRYCENFRFLTE